MRKVKCYHQPLGATRAQKVFFEELYKQCAMLLHAADKQHEASEAEACQHSVEEDTEYLRLLAEDQHKALEAQHRAEEEAAAARREEEHRQAQEHRCRHEEHQHQHTAREKRRERACLEQEHREQEHLEEKCREYECLEQEHHAREQEALRQKVATEAAALVEWVGEWHRYYEEKWAVLRTDAKVLPLAFSDIPWPLFGIPKSSEDITLVHVQEFLCHPQHESTQSTGQAKSLSRCCDGTQTSGAWECMTNCDTVSTNPKSKIYLVAGWALKRFSLGR
jgi:hypothetical protein